MPNRIGHLGGAEFGRPRGTQFLPGNAYGANTRWCFHVDDIAIHFMGTPAAVAQAISQTTSAVIQELEGGLKMEVSRRDQWSNTGKGKSVVAIASPIVRVAVSTSRPRLGIKMQSKAPHLRVLFRLGARAKGSKA